MKHIIRSKQKNMFLLTKRIYRTNINKDMIPIAQLEPCLLIFIFSNNCYLSTIDNLRNNGLSSS